MNTETELFFELMRRNGIERTALLNDDQEEFYILLGFYGNELTDLLLSDASPAILDKHVRFIEDLIRSGNSTIITALEIDLFITLLQDVGRDNYIIQQFSPTALNVYQQAVDRWIENEHRYK